MFKVRMFVLFITMISAVNVMAATAVYDRKDWSIWRTAKCISTREQVLINTSQSPVITTNAGCTVKGGVWFDPYTNTIYNTALQIDIDHLVPPRWAIDHGAAKWLHLRKGDFANDLDNLTPVGSSINRSKGDRGPREWLPPTISYQCTYITRFNNVVAKYHLRYKLGERVWMNDALSACKNNLPIVNTGVK